MKKNGNININLHPIHIIGMIVIGGILYSMSGFIINCLAVYGTVVLVNKYDKGYLKDRLGNSAFAKKILDLISSGDTTTTTMNELESVY